MSLPDLRYPGVNAQQTGPSALSAFGTNVVAWPGVAHVASALRSDVYRLHDYSGGSATWRTRWQKIETSKGVFDWGTLDADVATLMGTGADILFTVFATPSWASARPSEASAYGGSNLGIAAEPANMQDLADFCTAIATRYKGKIKYYEVWNEANEVGFFSGTQAKLAEMVRRAAVAIKSADPNALIVGPSVTYLWPSGTGLAYLQSMLAASDGAGGALKDWIDIVSVHLYASTNPRIGEVSCMVKRVRDVMQLAGVAGLPLWNTESAVLSPAFSTLAANERAAAIQRLLLLPLCSNYGAVDCTFVYAPDGSSYGFVSDDVTQYNALADAIAAGEVSGVRVSPDGRLSYSLAGEEILVPVAV